MAKQGVIIGSFDGTTANCASIRAEWSYTQDISKNNTTLTVNLTVRRDKSGTSTYRNSTPYSFAVGNTTKNGNYNFDITKITVGNSITIATITKTISHNADGSCPSQSVAATFDLSGTTLGMGSVRAAISIDDIPRAGIITLESTSVNMGDVLQITLSNYYNDFTYDLIYIFENGDTVTIANSISKTFSWTIPNLAKYIPNAPSGICILKCMTYNGDEFIGLSTASVTITVPDTSTYLPSAIPARTEITDLNKTVGGYVKTLSKLKFTLTTNGRYGATIVSRVIKVNGETFTSAPAETDFLKYAGENIAEFTVTDSRGKSTTVTSKFNVLDYNKPYISSFSVDRLENNYVQATVNAGITDINTNTAKYSIRYTKKGDTTVNGYAISDKDVSLNKSYKIPRVDGNSQYTFEFVVSDLWNTATLSYDVGTEFALIDYNASGTGLAIGKVSEDENALEIALPLKFSGNVLADMFYPVGSIYMSVNNTNPSQFFGGTWEEWGSGRVPVGVNPDNSDFNTVEKTGGTYNVNLSEDQIPKHSHDAGSLVTESTGSHSHDIQNQKQKWGTSNASNYTLIDASSGFTAVSNKTTTSAGTHTHVVSGNTATAGGGKSHNNVQPYITCYMWKRTA